MEINIRVKRWDVYDIADELADVPGMLTRSLAFGEYPNDVLDLVKDLERRLWEAAERGGIVGPYPGYDEESPVAGPMRGLVIGAALSLVMWFALAVLVAWLAF